MEYGPRGSSIIAAAYGRFIGLLQESRPGQAILWDVKTGKRHMTMSNYADGVSSVAFSPDGRTLWPSMPKVNSVAFSPEGRTLAVAFGEPVLPGAPDGVGVVQLWDTEQSKPIAIVPHDSFVAQVAYSRHGGLLAIAGAGSSATVRDAKTYEEVAKFEGGALIAFSPDGRELLVTNRGPVLRIEMIASKAANPPQPQSESPPDSAESGGVVQ